MASNSLDTIQDYVDHYYQTFLARRFGINSCKPKKNIAYIANRKFIAGCSVQETPGRYTTFTHNNIDLDFMSCPIIIPAVTTITTDGNTLSFIAGENLVAGKLVYIKTGQIYLYDGTDPLLADMLLGMTKTNAITGASVDIQIGGIYLKPGLGLIAGATYFAGTNGQLSTTPLLVCTIAGIAVSTDGLKIEIQQSIITL